MTKKMIFGVIFLLFLTYPGILILNLETSIAGKSQLGEIENHISGLQISIWLTWVVMVSISVYHKWTSERNLFFHLTYFFLVLAMSFFGFYVQRVMETFGIDTGFKDPYTFGFLTALQNFAVAAILTGFLQAGVWWFTRRWHRR